jgi:hypothetical protein
MRSGANKIYFENDSIESFAGCRAFYFAKEGDDNIFAPR